MSTTLISSKGKTERVQYGDLEHIATPPSSRYWRPVSHKQLVDTLTQEVYARGFEVSKADYAIGNDGLKLFGTMDLMPANGRSLLSGIGNAIGFRHSNDKRVALQIVGGARVFVCDNMAFSGDATILKHKHTWNFSIRDLISHGLDIWTRKQGRMVADIERMARTPLSNEQAQSVMAKALYEGVTTFQTFKLAYDLFFERACTHPEQYQDCAPRTLWGLHNAYTRALKESTPNAAFNGTIELAKVFGLGTESTYALAA